MSFRKIALSAVTVLGLFACACAGADGQSTHPGEGQQVAAPEHAGNVEDQSYRAQCNARCYANYTSALESCDGDQTCLCFTDQEEGECLAQCAGRTYIRHAC